MSDKYLATTVFRYVGPPGASPETLERRIKYGGRKGRSAERRLSRGVACTVAFKITIPNEAPEASPSESKDSP